jgi:hypothetical protein
MAQPRFETVGTSTIQIAPYNKDRTSISILNNHASNILYIGDDAGLTTTEGFPIRSYNGITLAFYSGDDPRRAIYAVASGASTNVRILEGFGGWNPTLGGGNIGSLE